MPEVSIQINERLYPVACEEGEKEHLVRLGRYVDKRVKELAKSVGQIGEAHLLAMACLVVADELSEANDRAHASRDEVSASILERSSETLDRAAITVERMTEKLEKSMPGSSKSG
jgi:cell division protein ZapA